jgi:predicted membrane-bound spermidine synthase
VTRLTPPAATALADSLVLRRRGGALELVSGSVVLLSSAALETERAFGRLAAPFLSGTPRRVIVGGLGLGATVRGLLDVSTQETNIVVVEKVEAVVALVRGELSHFSDRALDDPRVSVVCADVAEVIGAAQGDVDAILLDVDNGPEWASFRHNARLYVPAGLAVARRALRPGGALAVWSGYPADPFRARLRAAGLAPSVELLRERGRVRARAYVGIRSPISPLTRT